MGVAVPIVAPTMFTNAQLAHDWKLALRFHRVQRNQSSFRWGPPDVVHAVGLHTGGRLDFTSLRDLQRVSTAILSTRKYRNTVDLALGDRLVPVFQVMGRVPETVDLLDLDIHVAGHTEGLSGLFAPAKKTNDDVQRVLKRLAPRNPLTEAWELVQLLHLWQAAVRLLEGVELDLAAELLERHPWPRVLNASGEMSRLRLLDEAGFRQRHEAHIDAVGGVDGAGQIPTQTYPALPYGPLIGEEFHGPR